MVATVKQLFAGAIVGLVAGLVGGGGIVAVLQFFQTNTLAEQAAFVSIVQSRVASCFEIASYHRSVVDTDASTELVVLDSNGEVLERPFESTNFERVEASVRMGRELDLCLATSKTHAILERCVRSATHEQSGKRVVDDMGETTAAGYRIGQENPAC